MNRLANLSAHMDADSGTNCGNSGIPTDVLGFSNELLSTPAPVTITSETSVPENPIPTLDHVFDPRIPQLLPHENMYKIQVGSRLFKISGASLSSDGPNYFTKCFSKRAQRNYESVEQVLFIDRSSEIFQLIYDHLQGYFINVKNEVEYTMLYADAMYYSLPRLRMFLRETEYYFTNIGGKSFRIPKSLLSRRGDSPNYFLMMSAALYADIENVFIEKKLLRPPPQAPPYVPRSPEYFNDLMHFLGGSSLKLNECRREALIKECRYYRFLNLEQRLIKHKIVYNPYNHHEEIFIGLKDLNHKGIELSLEKEKWTCSSATPPFEDSRFLGNGPENQQTQSCQPPLKRKKSTYGTAASDIQKCWDILKYKRPYVDDYSRRLSFQIDLPECTLIFNRQLKTIHVCLHNKTAYQFESVFSSELSKMGINLANFKVKMGSVESISDSKPSIQLALPACISVCDLSVNGIQCSSLNLLLSNNQNDEQVPDLNSSFPVSFCPGFKLHLGKSIWKLGVRPGKLIMIAVKIQAFDEMKEFCKSIEYL